MAVSESLQQQVSKLYPARRPTGLPDGGTCRIVPTGGPRICMHDPGHLTFKMAHD